MIESQLYLAEVKLKRDDVPSFAHYPFSIPAIRTLTTLDLRQPVTFLVGENGSGKSTLLEAIAVAYGFNAEGGTKNFQFDTRASHSELHRFLRLVRSFRQPKDGFFFRAESFFNVATEIERMDGVGGYGAPVINSYGHRSLHEQSHGESFFSVFLNRFGGHGVYILDEPEAALSPVRQMALIRRIHELVDKQSQFLIATHSPFLLAYPDAKIFEIDAEGINERDYLETDHYLLAKRFFSDPAAHIARLLADLV